MKLWCIRHVTIYVKNIMKRGSEVQMFLGNLDGTVFTGYVKSGTLVNRKFCEFLIPTLLMSMSSQLGVFFDGVIVSYLLGAVAMASVGASMPLTQAAAALSVMISVGAVGHITTALGIGEKNKASFIFSTACVLSLGIGILLTALLYAFSAELSAVISPASSMTQGCYEYLHVLVFRFPFSISLSIMCDIVRSDGMAALSSYSVMIQQCSNIIMDFVFIKYFGLGLEGAALATVLSDVAGIGYILLIYSRSKDRTFRLSSPISEGIVKFIKRTFEICRAGLPATFGMICVAVKVWCIYKILGSTGGAGATQIYAACMLYLSLLSMFVFGANSSAYPILGVLYGEKDYRSIRMFMRYIFRFMLLIVVFAVMFSILFPKEFLILFRLSADLAASGASSVRLFSVSLVGVAMTFIMIYYYTAVKQDTVGNILSLTEGFFAVIPAAWVFSRLWGQIGVWIALIFAEIAGAAVVLVYVKYKCAYSDGKLSDFYLIETNGSELLYDVSLKATESDAAKLSQEASGVLEARGMDRVTAMKVGIALEEITANMALINVKPVDFDVRILHSGEEILLALRDNGKEFNPMEYQPSADEEADYRSDRIMVLRALSGDIKYDRVLSLNQTLITIKANAE